MSRCLEGSALAATTAESRIGGEPQTPPPQQQRQQSRLQAVVDIIGVWETDACEASPTTAAAAAETNTLPVAERVRRSRAEASVRALVDPASFSNTPARAERGSERDGSTGAMMVGDGEQEDEPIVALMREWWPKLISTAAEAREWVFLCRYVIEPWRSEIRVSSRLRARCFSADACPSYGGVRSWACRACVRLPCCILAHTFTHAPECCRCRDLSVLFFLCFFGHPGWHIVHTKYYSYMHRSVSLFCRSSRFHYFCVSSFLLAASRRAFFSVVLPVFSTAAGACLTK